MAVDTFGRLRQRLEDQPPDRLAVLQNERHLLRSLTQAVEEQPTHVRDRIRAAHMRIAEG